MIAMFKHHLEKNSKEIKRVQLQREHLAFQMIDPKKRSQRSVTSVGIQTGTKATLTFWVFFQNSQGSPKLARALLSATNIWQVSMRFEGKTTHMLNPPFFGARQ